MNKVAIITPTMNRPDFMLRQFAFCRLMKSPHPIYIADSSNPENAEKIKKDIEKFKDLDITYQWYPPGKDPLYSLLGLVKEKYCILINDDDFALPDALSESADFLENNSDYATCAGKQINYYFRGEDSTKPYGIIGHQTRPLGVSLEDENMLRRVKDLWFKWIEEDFLIFAVRKTETEKELRNIIKHLSIIEDMNEFLIFSFLAVSGKYKMLDRLMYFMYRGPMSQPIHNLEDFILSPGIVEKWQVCEREFAKSMQRRGLTEKESLAAVRGMFMIFFAGQIGIENGSWESMGQDKSVLAKQNLSGLKRLRCFASHLPLLKKIYYKFSPPSDDVSLPESKYFKDFKQVKDFLENKNPIR